MLNSTAQARSPFRNLTAAALVACRATPFAVPARSQAAIEEQRKQSKVSNLKAEGTESEHGCRAIVP